MIVILTPSPAINACCSLATSPASLDTGTSLLSKWIGLVPDLMYLQILMAVVYMNAYTYIK